jgi:hypothetical protein
LFLFGMPAFQFATFGLNKLLQCPNCGDRALPKRLFAMSDPAKLVVCNSCGCRLRRTSAELRR